MASHHLLTAPGADTSAVPPDWQVMHASRSVGQITLLVLSDSQPGDPAWTAGQVGLEDLVLAYMSQAAEAADRMQALEVLTR